LGGGRTAERSSTTKRTSPGFNDAEILPNMPNDEEDFKWVHRR